MKNHKTKILTLLAALAVLAFVFWWGGNSPGVRGWNIPEKAAADNVAAESKDIIEENAETKDVPQKDTSTDTKENEDISKEKPSQKDDKGKEEKVNQTTNDDKNNTQQTSVQRPPINPSDVKISQKELTCTLSIRCDTILDNMSWLDSSKVSAVPKDGVILAKRTVTFYEGETVFNLLTRESKRNKIHMEFVNTPIYNSAYIEGIGNLYEFDCGERSGWMYRVNGWFPNYGCSCYQLREGDNVEWIYTCDLGADIGGGYSTRNGMKTNE